MTHCDNRELRKELYLAYGTRSSRFGSGGEKYDNTEIISELLKKRQDLAKVLGFENYAELSVAKKMAGSPRKSYLSCENLAEKQNLKPRRK